MTKNIHSNSFQVSYILYKKSEAATAKKYSPVVERSLQRELFVSFFAAGTGEVGCVLSMGFGEGVFTTGG